MNITSILTILVFVLGISVFIMANYIVNIKKSLSKMIIVLNDIKKGNRNRKVLISDNNSASDIGYKINEILDDYRSKIIELEEGEETYKRMLIGFSHDVRTPLTSLVGYLDAIHNKVVHGKEKDDYLEIARDKAYNLKDFVELLFEWFKLDAKEMAFHFEDVDINELTRSALTDWVPIFDERGIKFYIDIQDKEFIVSADVNAYMRIINNIIQNAVLHSRCSKVNIEVLQKDDEAVIMISDNGKGIARKDLPHVFDRLYKCDESRSAGGNGLGLAIVKELVEIHHGRIEVESILNEGTTFTITIPIRKAL
ncbi:sensor histidine kinase [Acidilutibacter cellobiosedens]|nr:HAMP domain-containing sensor histidine kinase [Acidilutibacter cellobiosedens]